MEIFVFALNQCAMMVQIFLGLTLILHGLYRLTQIAHYD